jgi:predicted MFS family arabinose efflux permease
VDRRGCAGGRLTEGITLFTTGLGAGLAPGAALVGVVADRSGASSAFSVTVAAGLLGSAVAFLTARCCQQDPESGVLAGDPNGSVKILRRRG